MMNAGYKIILRRPLQDGSAVVLGKNPNTGMWVTWKERSGSYYWGHYFDKTAHGRKTALADFCSRIHEETVRRCPIDFCKLVRVLAEDESLSADELHETAVALEAVEREGGPNHA